MSVPVVENDEYLYRRVSAKSDWYYRSGDRYMIHQAAFQDNTLATSVDRAALLSPKNDPTQTQRNPTDGVFCIKAGDVRDLGPIETITPSGTVKHHVDVIPDGPRRAHAIITVNPRFPNTSQGKGAHQQLRLLLARLVNGNPPVFILEPIP